MLGPATQRFHHLALARDAVGGRTIFGQRMAATRFRKAAFKLGARAIEEQRLDVALAGFAQFLDPADEQRRFEAATAAVDADRDRAADVAALDRRVDQRVEQRERQVIDDFPAQILKHIQRSRLARARQARHEHEPLFGARAHAPGASRSSASMILIGADASNADRRSAGNGCPATISTWFTAGIRS